MDEKEEKDRIEAWDRAVYCFGTAKIFEKRLKQLNILNKGAKFIGLAVPLIIGYFVMTFGKENVLSASWFLYTAAILGFVQLSISLWALVDNWDDKLQCYAEFASENIHYSDTFENIGKRYGENKVEYARLLREMIALDGKQRKLNSKMNISRKENRYAMRYSLFQFERECVECKTIPIVDKPKRGCSICGK